MLPACESVTAVVYVGGSDIPVAEDGPKDQRKEACTTLMLRTESGNCWYGIRVIDRSKCNKIAKQGARLLIAPDATQ